MGWNGGAPGLPAGGSANQVLVGPQGTAAWTGAPSLTGLSIINGGHINMTLGAGVAPSLTNVHAQATASSVTGTDGAGTISITLNATGAAAGARLCTLNFGAAFGNANYGVAIGITSGQTTTTPRINTKAAGSFDLIAGAAMANGTWTVDYIVIGNG